jgi:hypothetical protein
MIIILAATMLASILLTVAAEARDGAYPGRPSATNLGLDPGLVVQDVAETRTAISPTRRRSVLPGLRSAGESSIIFLTVALHGPVRLARTQTSLTELWYEQIRQEANSGKWL